MCMILFEFIGLDQYLVGNLSKSLTKPLANILETSPDDIDFYAPNAQIYHDGVEQTSWHGLIRVSLPERFHPFEEKVAKVLIHEVKEVMVNIRIEFHYYEEHHVYEHRNEEYPLFMKDNVKVEVDEEKMLDSEEEDDELYEGNIFKEILGEDYEK